MRHQAAPILAFWARLWPETLQRVEGPSLIRLGARSSRSSQAAGANRPKSDMLRRRVPTVESNRQPVTEG